MKQHANYIAGEWVESPKSLTNINPSDLSDVVGYYAEPDQAMTQRAIAARVLSVSVLQ